MTRSCGSCTSCCFVLGVTALDKPTFQRCSQELRGGGCAIYDSRPEPCRAYRCGWLDGLGERRDRPDRLGVIVDRVAPKAELFELARAGDAQAQAAVVQAKRTIHAREVRHGALSEPRVKQALEALTRAGWLVVLMPFMGRKLPVGRAL